MDVNRHIDIMGIVNVNDDSFFEGSRARELETALGRIGSMLEDGATIIDLGACSTRPGSVAIGAEEEWRRLEPILSAVRDSYPGVCISVDTYWSEVVRKTYDLIGEFIVNDISSGQMDEQMLPVVGNHGLKYIAMHMRGTPENMQMLTDYSDVVGDVLTFFKQLSSKLLKNGISDWVVDPGFGFAKTIEQNYEMLSRLEEFQALGHRVLVGLSRKSMIYKLLDVLPEDTLSATQTLNFKALQNGADILRVHDVKETVQTLKLYRILG